MRDGYVIIDRGPTEHCLGRPIWNDVKCVSLSSCDLRVECESIYHQGINNPFAVIITYESEGEVEIVDEKDVGKPMCYACFGLRVCDRHQMKSCLYFSECGNHWKKEIGSALVILEEES